MERQNSYHYPFHAGFEQSLQEMNRKLDLLEKKLNQTNLHVNQMEHYIRYCLQQQNMGGPC
ncbi:hypothetical protein [Heyndrickxia acidiproducens]|uniref:hypothetical protein n=1 Tax=Heyndrickxia acidiproducens TaxID=1121084 RepID=UPI0003654362|nr:hypothetical protein [Heyndrickxia acidiproducens]